MQSMAIDHQTSAAPFTIPRGWVIAGLALASWAFVIAFGFGVVQLFQFVSGGLVG